MKVLVTGGAGFIGSPLARRLHAETPFDLVDAQFFYPDGPAAMRVADELGLPFSVKLEEQVLDHHPSLFQPNTGDF